ncbi:MAG: protein kinase [bacterium]|nr:protein kinase [bacterium]
MERDKVLKAVQKKLGKKYGYVKQLQGGGFSNVYLIRHTLFNEDHVLKIMDFHYLYRKLEKENFRTADHEFDNIRQRFINEAKVYKKLDHPNIVKIFDIDTVSIRHKRKDIEIPFLIMQYVKGYTLKRIVETGEPLKFKRALGIVKDILAALDFIHRNNIIHRDIKPDNIMIVEESGHAVLIDFGLAKDKLNEVKLTSGTVTMGTPAYMSPEQCTDSSSVTSQTDIYSLGVVFFEMLTGDTPFGGKNTLAMINGHIRKSIPDISKRNPALPRSMKPIMLKAMAKKPEKRYASPSEFLEALRELENQYDRGRISIKRYRSSSSLLHRGAGVIKRNFKYILWGLSIGLVIVLVFLGLFWERMQSPDSYTKQADSTAATGSQKPGEPETSRFHYAAFILESAEKEFLPMVQLFKNNYLTYSSNLQAAQELLERGSLTKATEALEKAKLIFDSEEVRLLAEAILGKRADRYHGETDFQALKDAVSLNKYLEFRERYPKSKYIDQLRELLKSADKKLPPAKYWDLPSPTAPGTISNGTPLPGSSKPDGGHLNKNKKGYYEYVFGEKHNRHRMVYIPTKKIWIDKYEVSWSQYRKFSAGTSNGRNTYINKGNSYPAVVGYREAVNYCRAHGFRLPKVKEWEYAAGLGKLTYPWGNYPGPGQKGIWRANFESLKDGYEGTAPVNSFANYCSPFGAVNMAGNVKEWVQNRLLKGGGFFSEEEDLMIIKNINGGQKDKEGFRCVKEEKL